MNEIESQLQDQEHQIHSLTDDLKKLSEKFEALSADYYLNNFKDSQDFVKTSRFLTRLSVPVYAVLPTAATIGQLVVVSGNGKLYVASDVNTWSLVGTQI